MRGRINRMSKWIWLKLLELHGGESSYCICPLNLNLNEVRNNIVWHWALWHRSSLCASVPEPQQITVHMVYINGCLSPNIKCSLSVYIRKLFVKFYTYNIFTSSVVMFSVRIVNCSFAIIVSLFWQTHSSTELCSQWKSIRTKELQHSCCFQWFYDWYLLLCFSDLKTKIKFSLL